MKRTLVDIQRQAKARRAAAYILKCEGWTYEEIGRNFGVCRERARQLVVGGAKEKLRKERRFS